MSRSKTRARRARNGMPQETHKSTTSPCALKRVQVRKEDHALGRLYSRHHRKRTELKARLVEDLGLPREAVLIFRKCIKDPTERSTRQTLKISFGTVVVINKEDLCLVLAVRCTRFSAMSASLKKSFFHSISTTYDHAGARLPLDLNSSVQALVDEDIFWGWQGGCGWRPGSDTGKSFGCYALNPKTAAKEERMATDEERMVAFHEIRDFWAERFATLSLSAFESNLQIGKVTQVPGFEELEWADTPNGLVFASNLIITRDFHNLPHTDKDRTRYAFGIFSALYRDSGIPAELDEKVNQSRVIRAKFIMTEFGLEVLFDECNGTTEMVWDTKSEHYTPPSISIDSEGREIPMEECPITRYGSSCQISEALVHRIELLHEKKKGMTDEQWAEYRKSRVKDYLEESSNKLMRAEASRLARTAKRQGKKKRNSQKQ